MKITSAFVRTHKLALVVGVALSVCMPVAFAQSQPSELNSDELMQRILELSGSADKRTLVEGYMQELINRAKAQQPSAMFNFGWYRYELCGTMKKQGLDVSSAPMCAQALSDLSGVAENPKINALSISTASMNLLGEMYRDGVGTKPSRFLAADWFVKAAKQKSASGDREGAIRSLEKALNASPEYSDALELRARLLK